MVKKKLSKTFVVLILLFTAFSLQMVSEKPLLSATTESNDYYNDLLAEAKNENLKLKLEFIGFNPDLVNEVGIESELYNHFKHSTSLPQADLNFNFEFNFANESIREDLEDHLILYGVNASGVGYELNVTLLYEDLASGNRSDIFMPRDGLSIDADLV
ncbi:MAG: hypothetical protein ACTSR6_07240, partial [Candidatus Heimdallarchaeota archaeon]